MIKNFLSIYYPDSGCKDESYCILTSVVPSSSIPSALFSISAQNDHHLLYLFLAHSRHCGFYVFPLSFALPTSKTLSFWEPSNTFLGH